MRAAYFLIGSIAALTVFGPLIGLYFMLNIFVSFLAFLTGMIS